MLGLTRVVICVYMLTRIYTWFVITGLDEGTYASSGEYCPRRCIRYPFLYMHLSFFMYASLAVNTHIYVLFLYFIFWRS